MNEIKQPQRCDVYSRVVGYFRPVDNWNGGKKAEFDDRREFVVQKQELEYGESLRNWQKKPTKCLLITTPTCPNCTYVKKQLEEKKFMFEIIDATTELGFEIAKKHHVSSVPAAIFIDDEKEVMAVELGHEKITKYLEVI